MKLENKFKLNLQLFAEDELSENTQEVAEPVDTDDDDAIFVDDDIEEVQSESDQTEIDKSANNQEIAEPEKKQSDEENSKYAAARREAEKQKRLNEERMNKFARDLGYNSFDELEQVQAQQKYLDQNYTPEMAERMAYVDMRESEMRQRENQARITEEKSKLRNQKFFADLEAEIDEHLTNVPEANVEVLFNMLKGQNFDKLIAQEKKATKQRTLNQLNNKDHIKPDGKGIDVDSTHVDDEEFAIAKKLDKTLTKEAYAKWKKQNK